MTEEAVFGFVFMVMLVAVATVCIFVISILDNKD